MLLLQPTVCCISIHRKQWMAAVFLCHPTHTSTTAQADVHMWNVMRTIIQVPILATTMLDGIKRTRKRTRVRWPEAGTDKYKKSP